MSEAQIEGTAAGKRYQCSSCGAQLLCTKPGTGQLVCCGAPMEELDPKPMPSAD